MAEREKKLGFEGGKLGRKGPQKSPLTGTWTHMALHIMGHRGQLRLRQSDKILLKSNEGKGADGMVYAYIHAPGPNREFSIPVHVYVPYHMLQYDRSRETAKIPQLNFT